MFTRAHSGASPCISGAHEHAEVRTHWSNVEARRKVGEPCIVCIVARARLRYLWRLLHHGPKELQALLWDGGRSCKWCAQIRIDLEMMRERQFMPEGCAFTFLRAVSRVAWANIVERLFWDKSSADPCLKILFLILLSCASSAAVRVV